MASVSPRHELMGESRQTEPRRLRAPPGQRSLRIPYWIYDAGFFKGRAMGSVLQVFTCLIRYMDWQTGNGRLGNTRLKATAGLRDPATLGRAFRQLQQLGLVKVWWQRTDRGFIRYYHVALTEAKMRENALTYLKLNLQRGPGGYRGGKYPARGREISPQEYSSVSYTKRGRFAQPLKTTILTLLERPAQPPRRSSHVDHPHHPD